jgi:hypothetical protein
LNWEEVFEAPMAYSWSRAGDQYSLLAFGNVVKLNGGELPREGIGLRVKMGTCFRRCAEATRPGINCADDTGFLPSTGINTDIGVTQDVFALCGMSLASQ